MKRIIVLLLIGQILGADQATQNLQRYLMANYHKDPQQAAHWFSLITPDDNSRYIYLGYIPFLAANQSYADIAKLIPQLDEQFKSNQEIQLIFAMALEQVGKKEEAYTRLISLNEKSKANQEIAFKVAQIYVERSEPENALTVIDNLLNTAPRRPNNYVFHFMKSQIYLQLNKKPEALAAVKQCIDTYAKFDKSWLLYAVLQEQEGKIQEAIKGYTTFLEITPQANKEIERHLLTLNLSQKLTQQKNASSPTGDIQERLLKIQTLADRKQFDQAAVLLADWAITDANNEVWLKTLHLLCYGGLAYKKALQILQVVEKKKGSSLELALYQSDLALRDNNQKLAFDSLKKAAALAKDPEIKTKIALQIAIIYYDQQKWQLAQKTLEEALTFGYSYAPVNNLLAYLYATKGKNLSRASELIDQALKQDGQNPHFLDTQALVFYKQKDYEKATSILQKVAHLCPTDYTVLCHLGKCYFLKGDTERAVHSLKSAVSVAKNDQEKSKAESLIARWNKP